jgi:hypothetical protein
VLTILFALNAPMAYLSGRPIHYHESIIFGVTLVVLSWLPLFAAFSSERHTHKYLLVSGLLIACALLSRMPLVMYAVATGAVLVGRALVRRDFDIRHSAAKLVAFGAPVALALGLLSAYNYARFESFTDLGTNYQLQGLPEYYETVIREGRPPANVANILPVLALYVVSAPSIGDSPPFLRDVTLVPNSVMRMSGLDAIHVDAPVMSIFLITPIAVIALACPILLFMRWRPELEPILAFMASLFVGGLLTWLLTCTVPGVSLRYTADFLPALTMVASLMMLLVVNRFVGASDPSRRSVGRAVTRHLIAYTILSLVPCVLLGLISGLAAWEIPVPPWG